MVSEEDARRLNRAFYGFFVDFLKRSGYFKGKKEEEIKEELKKKISISLDGEIASSYSNIPFYVHFHYVRGPQIRVAVEREARNGLLKKAIEEMDKVRSASQLEREHGYLDDRKVSYDGENEEIKVNCKVKRIPDIGQENLLFNDLISYVLGPLIKAGK